MQYLIIILVAFLASCLTFFSGFGLGTLLLPAFALFFPVQIAVALTAIVHLLNNIFKTWLVGKSADKSVVLKFGIPAIVASFAGAYALVLLSKFPPLYSYHALGSIKEITPIKIVLAVLIGLFALMELLPFFERISFDRKYLPLGGLLSGFFGGLSGNQGALRSAFLVKCKLSKESFIATGVIIAVLVDISRLSIYASSLSISIIKDDWSIVIFATLSAFAGAYLGSKLLKKVTYKTIQWLVSAMLFFIALGLGFGLV